MLLRWWIWSVLAESWEKGNPLGRISSSSVPCRPWHPPPFHQLPISWISKALLFFTSTVVTECFSEAQAEAQPSASDSGDGDWQSRGTDPRLHLQVELWKSACPVPWLSSRLPLEFHVLPPSLLLFSCVLPSFSQERYWLTGSVVMALQCVQGSLRLSSVLHLFCLLFCPQSVTPVWRRRRGPLHCAISMDVQLLLVLSFLSDPSKDLHTHTVVWELWPNSVHLLKNHQGLFINSWTFGNLGQCCVLFMCFCIVYVLFDKNMFYANAHFRVISCGLRITVSANLWSQKSIMLP